MVRLNKIFRPVEIGLLLAAVIFLTLIWQKLSAPTVPTRYECREFSYTTAFKNDSYEGKQYIATLGQTRIEPSGGNMKSWVLSPKLFWMRRRTKCLGAGWLASILERWHSMFGRATRRQSALGLFHRRMGALYQQ